MTQGPSHESKKYSAKARNVELEEEEVESLPPIPKKPAPHREEKPARSGPPGFNQPKRDPPSAAHQHEAPSNERRAEMNERMEAPKSIQKKPNTQQPPVEKSKPTPA